MISIAITLAVLIPFIGAHYTEKKLEKEKQKRPKRGEYKHHCKKLYERGRYKNKLFMTSSEYPYFDVPERGSRHRRGKSHFVRKSASSFDMSF